MNFDESGLHSSDSARFSSPFGSWVICFILSIRKVMDEENQPTNAVVVGRKVVNNRSIAIGLEAADNYTFNMHSNPMKHQARAITVECCKRILWVFFSPK